MASTQERTAVAEVVETLAGACALLARRVATAGIDGVSSGTLGENASGDVQKPLDVLADDLFFEAVAQCGSVGVFASEERAEGVVVGNGPLCIAIDPLDGSRNIESSLPTGAIYGIFRRGGVDDATAEMRNQAGGGDLLASGYCLFSSATTLVVALRGGGVHTWDLSQEDVWVATGTDIQMPLRGQTYSLNDARYFDWPDGLRRYIDAVRQGKGVSGKKYSARYVCCLVADFHRTLLTGGWCGNPRPHLRVLFENLPLALVAAEAGGAASDGRVRVLDCDSTVRRQPLKALHEHAPLFIGSAEDIEELESYGDVQQGGGQKYTI